MWNGKDISNVKIIEISQRDRKTGRCGLFINKKKIKSVLVGKKG